MKNFGAFIKTERVKRGWTQTYLGEKIGVKRSAISLFESGTLQFSKKKLELLANIFEVDKQNVIDLYFADKFARDAATYECSEYIFLVAEKTAYYLRNKNVKKEKLK